MSAQHPLADREPRAVTLAQLKHGTRIEVRNVWTNRLIDNGVVTKIAPDPLNLLGEHYVRFEVHGRITEALAADMGLEPYRDGAWELSILTVIVPS